MESTYTSSTGTKYWYLHGAQHREDGPAVEYANGEKRWHLNGKRHRIDGPAVEHTNGIKYYYLNGSGYTFNEWKQEVRKYYDTQEDYLLMLLKL